MFLSNLFKKAEVLLKAEIRISDNSKFELLNKSSFIGDKELILMGLLIFSRVLRVENSKEEKDLMLDLFQEFNHNLVETEDKENYKREIHNFFSVMLSYNSYSVDEKTVLFKLERIGKGNIYLDMPFKPIEPLSKLNNIVFKFIWENIDEMNQEKLLHAYTTLSVMYKLNSFSIRDAVSIPNEIIYEVIPFD